MSSRSQKFIAPVVILIIILLLWEMLVVGFEIEQFLLPRPSVIISNLVRVVVLSPEPPSPELSEIESTLRSRRLIVRVPLATSQDLIDQELTAVWGRFTLGDQTVLLVQGKNLSPILQASWFTLKEALGGFIIGCSLGILVSLATARWTATREALMPFAIAVNSMPIIAFAPIMNNWFGIDNPFSKMSIVAIMVFFPMMINSVKGLTLVEARSLELMRSYAASEFAILAKLRIPNALPYIFNGFKVAAALSMIGAVVGEYFGGPRIALGVFITQEAALFRFSSAWAAIIAACLMGITLYIIIVIIERLVMPWHVSFRS